MAHLDNRQPQNAIGKFYVTVDCIDCDLCRETAPDFFVRSDDTGLSYVQTQPASPEDVAKCMEALEGCPVEAIGSDGDSASP